MSFGTHGKAAIPDRIVCEYALTDRSSCKTCGGGIPKDTVKIGEKVRSPWHDGFDTKWSHDRCVYALANNVHDIKGFQRLRWKDQVAIAEKIQPGSTASPDAELRRCQRLSEMMWELKDKLEKVPKGARRDLIEANGVFCSDKAHPVSMLHGIADGLLCGLLPLCPWCGGRSLEQEGSLVRCYGYSNASTHCTFKACVRPLPGCADAFGSMAAETYADLPLLEREGRWKLTDAIQRALKGWALPKDAPVLTGASDGASGGAGGTAVGDAGGSVSGAAVGSMPSGDVSGEQSESEDEEVPEGREMAGMAFACIGTLDPPAAELGALIEAHAGTFVTGSIGDASVITHLVASEVRWRTRPTTCTIAPLVLV